MLPLIRNMIDCFYNITSILQSPALTINRLGIAPSLHRCLATTNLIESPQSGVRMRTRRVCRWRDPAMVARWAAASFLATEKNFRRIMGWKDLWQLEATLGRKALETAAFRQEVA
jgi:putative transposase